jgi:3-oxoacyl-[acyl-carrier protein] reductase
MKSVNQIFNPDIFRGKVVLVTGSSEGIGRTTVLEFARHGANIIINYRHEEDLAKSLFAKTNTKFGRLDILVNNAGVNLDKTVLKMPRETRGEVIGINLTDVFNCCKKSVPVMINQGVTFEGW